MIQRTPSLNQDRHFSLRFYTHHAVLVNSARFRTLLPRIPFWNMDFKVPVVIKDGKERYLTLFLRAHQKEQLWLCRQAPSFHIAEFAEERVSMRQIWCKPLFLLNCLFNSAHLHLIRTTSPLQLRMWRQLKTHHCTLKKEKGGLLSYISKADRFHKMFYSLQHTLSIITVFPPPLFFFFFNSYVWKTIGCYNELNCRAIRL